MLRPDMRHFEAENSPVITRSHDIRPITTMIVIHIIHPLFVRVQAKVGDRVAEGPDLDGVVETGRSERLGVFGVDGECHDVVGVAFKDLFVSEPSFAIE